MSDALGRETLTDPGPAFFQLVTQSLNPSRGEGINASADVVEPVRRIQLGSPHHRGHEMFDARRADPLHGELGALEFEHRAGATALAAGARALSLHQKVV
jgi:hypothetical protein